MQSSAAKAVQSVDLRGNDMWHQPFINSISPYQSNFTNGGYSNVTLTNNSESNSYTLTKANNLK